MIKLFISKRNCFAVGLGQFLSIGQKKSAALFDIEVTASYYVAGTHLIMLPYNVTKPAYANKEKKTSHMYCDIFTVDGVECLAPLKPPVESSRRIARCE